MKTVLALGALALSISFGSAAYGKPVMLGDLISASDAKAPPAPTVPVATTAPTPAPVNRLSFTENPAHYAPNPLAHAVVRFNHHLSMDVWGHVHMTDIPLICPDPSDSSSCVEQPANTPYLVSGYQPQPVVYRRPVAYRVRVVHYDPWDPILRPAPHVRPIWRARGGWRRRPWG